MSDLTPNNRPFFNNPPSGTGMLTLAIQAGGKSSRMGSNKAKVSFWGQPLILRILERLQGVAEQVMILSNTNDLNYGELAGIPVYPDLITDIGPLGGLYTALKQANTELVAMVACDMPFANASLLRLEREIAVRSGCDAVIPHSEHGLEPMHSLYRRETCLPAIEAALERGERRMISWFGKVHVQEIGVERLQQIDPHLRMFLNVNTIEELHAAEKNSRQI